MTYLVGDQVRVAARDHEGHHRTPGYCKGKTGRIERVHGSFTNPETRAYGADGLPEQLLYSVGFNHGDYQVYADIFEHWLEEAK
jgi:Nitrile hydratase beta subunit, C-terminal